MKKIIILLLLCLSLVSCKEASLGKSDITENETQAETVAETESIDLNKEIAENYTNKVVSYETFMEFYEDYPCDGFGLKENPTYYELVKALDSTGVNTSEIFYRYEWVLDNGKFLYAYFYLDEFDGKTPSVEYKADIITVQSYSVNPDNIKKYNTYADYLYDVFYEKGYVYHDFLNWLGAREIPEYIGTQLTEEETKLCFEGFEKTIVSKSAALNIKEGMRLYEAVKMLGGMGEFDAAVNTVWWECEGDFYVCAGLFNDESGGLEDCILTHISYKTKDTIGLAENAELIDIIWR